MPKNEVTDEELLALYKDRLKDKSQARSRRRKQVESLPKPFSDLLGVLFKGDAEAMRRIEETRAVQAWAACVGECAARYSEALRVRGQTLIVYVGDGLWMQQLGLLKPELLRKYRESFPKLGLNDIYFTRQKRY